MGTKPAMGGVEVLPFRLEYRALMRLVTVEARVVFPVYPFVRKEGHWRKENCVLYLSLGFRRRRSGNAQLVGWIGTLLD